MTNTQARKLPASSFSNLIDTLYCIQCETKTRIEYQTIIENNDETFFAIAKCIDCDRLTMFHYDEYYKHHGEKKPLIGGAISISVELLRSYPNQSETDTLDVPKKIAKSYLEGVRCLDANSPNGAVTMFRRALEQVCLKLEADPQDRLEDQVKVLPSDIRPDATEIRKWGNLGGHEDNTGKIVEVSITQAKSIKQFIERVFLVVFQHPEQLKKLSTQRN